MSALLLSEWLAQSKVRPVMFEGDTSVTGWSENSKNIQEGQLFVAMPGTRGYQAEYLKSALQKGAVAVLTGYPEAYQDALRSNRPAVLLECDPNILSLTWSPEISYGFYAELGQMGAYLNAEKLKQTKLLGVTGTNGKTTTAWLLRQVLESMGKPSGYLGTVGIYGPSGKQEATNTTPFPVELWNQLSALINSGAQWICMEASSHALVQNRLSGIQFERGVFLNLSQDHLDYHLSMEEYARCKRLLFKQATPVLNIADSYGEEWSHEFRPELLTSFGTPESDVFVQLLESGIDFLELQVVVRGREDRVKVPIGGEYNVENLNAVIATLVALEFPVSAILQGLTEVVPVPGRFQSFVGENGVAVVVDYAHTADALEKLLHSVRKCSQGKVISVFGCGGDRDRGKRPKMAKVSTALADLTILTLDNPRTEDPEQIFADLSSGLTGNWKRVTDRAEAIRHAVAEADAGDVVVISGKGHEDYQIFGREKVPFDDAIVAQQALKEVAQCS